MNRWVVLSLIFFFACQGPNKEVEFTSMNAGQLVNKDFLVTVPYSYSADSAVVIDVVINNIHYKFMLDTGAPLAISKSLQAQLNFPLLYISNLIDANGDSQGVEIVRMPDLEISGLKFKDIPAVVLDFPKVPFDCDHIEGLVGSNLLRLLVIQFNKRKQKIFLANHLEKLPPDSGTIQLPLYLNPTQSDPHIPISIDQGITDTLLFDSGDNSMYQISKSKFDEFNKNGKLDQGIIAEGIGVNSQGLVAANTDSLSSFIFRTNLSIGNATIRNVIAEPNYSNQSRIGRELFNYGLVTMDYPGSKFYFLPYKKEMVFVSNPVYGFKYGERNNKLLITQVLKNTEAFKNGLRPGYEILQLGDFIPSTKPICDWRKEYRKETSKDPIIVKYADDKGVSNTCRLKKIEL